MTKKKNGSAKKPYTMLDAYQATRKTWGSFSPVTRIKGSKKAKDSKKACRGKVKLSPSCEPFKVNYLNRSAKSSSFCLEEINRDNELFMNPEGMTNRKIVPQKINIKGTTRYGFW